MDEDEKQIYTVVELFFTAGICLSKVECEGGRTPDLESSNILVEVKKLSPNLNGKDSIINSLRDDLENAAKQLRDYDCKHSKTHFIAIFADFYDQHEIDQDIHTVFTGEFSLKVPDKIFLSSYTLSNQYRAQIDGVLWFKDGKLARSWYKNDCRYKIIKSFLV